MIRKISERLYKEGSAEWKTCIMKVLNFPFNKQPSDIYVKLIHCRGLYLMNTENLCDSNVSYGIPHMQ